MFLGYLGGDGWVLCKLFVSLASIPFSAGPLFFAYTMYILPVKSHGSHSCELHNTWLTVDQPPSRPAEVTMHENGVSNGNDDMEEKKVEDDGVLQVFPHRLMANGFVPVGDVVNEPIALDREQIVQIVHVDDVVPETGHIDQSRRVVLVDDDDMRGALPGGVRDGVVAIESTYSNPPDGAATVFSFQLGYTCLTCYAAARLVEPRGVPLIPMTGDEFMDHARTQEHLQNLARLVINRRETAIERNSPTYSDDSDYDDAVGLMNESRN